MSEVPGKEEMRKLGEPFPEIEEEMAERGSSGWTVYATRLDQVFGYLYWSSDFDRTSGADFRCTITLKRSGVQRVGVGKDKNEAFIHACMQFGIGQYLHAKAHLGMG